MNRARQRPAELSGVAGALAILVAYLFGVDDPEVIVALAIVLGFVPAAVTWVVVLVREREQGGGV